jgi:hypothetical protein
MARPCRSIAKIAVYFLVLILPLVQAKASANVVKAEMPAVSYFDINLLSNAPAQKPLSPDAREKFRVPSLEIFDPQGTPVFFSNNTPMIVKTLNSLDSTISSLKPIEGYLPLGRVLDQLQNAGVQVLDKLGKKKAYTLLLVGLSGGQCKPCNDVDGAMDAFVRKGSGENHNVLELSLKTGNRQ